LLRTRDRRVKYLEDEPVVARDRLVWLRWSKTNPIGPCRSLDGNFAAAFLRLHYAKISDK
jgi:hypothetical protein